MKLDKCIKKSLFFILLFVSSTFCFGRQISFQIVEHNNSVEKVTDKALSVEDDLIASFFNSGYIVTNSIASLSASEEQDNDLWVIGMNEALNGYSDYFVQIILHFTEKENEKINKKVMVLEKVDYSLSSTKSGKIESKGTFNCNLEIYDSNDLADVSASLIDAINKVLKA